MVKGLGYLSSLKAAGASMAPEHHERRSSPSDLFALKFLDRHCVQGSDPTDPMLAERYDFLSDKARRWVVYDLQAQGLTDALQWIVSGSNASPERKGRIGTVSPTRLRSMLKALTSQKSDSSRVPKREHETGSRAGGERTKLLRFELRGFA